ncbi:hypothetical protein LMH87_004845 [Akanthomyces muscarius]|uniref:Uncharacterized protein n=1 Tax=Akanthomyces muscarius TaxID=2231603 RepID=A0A9W8Q4J3_AKAMU|nr:hypothetical protein LMH87_004845 [Akanthomyces muscarius]KAJ4146015.1 hypothetical protein LMH87_004845 [Akanthomyces muscarius]
MTRFCKSSFEHYTCSVLVELHVSRRGGSPALFQLLEKLTIKLHRRTRHGCRMINNPQKIPREKDRPMFKF